ncbi:MAG TPA: RIP metalloprotease RseP [Micavibrio sp.]|mgnify:FL=1|nr:RIP metalloprotease RseP [Micavibrio sp.]HIL29054.1 RIP metalloprotease RseP [Micavibrio sp.]
MSSSIFDWFSLIAENVWLYGGAFILVLSILVFVHEWGHYIVARMCGVGVESFSIGFGKELFGRTDKNGTRWKFCLVPLGGYVKMFGDLDPASAGHSDSVADGEEVREMTAEEREQAFFAKPVRQRAAVVFAGPAINFIFAILIMTGIFMYYGQPITPPVASAVMGGSAAERAGFQPHDEIIAIGGKKIRRFEEIRREVMVGLDTERTYTIRRNGEVIEIEATPEKEESEDRFGFKSSRGLLGLISPGSALQIEYIKSVDGVAYDSVDDVRAAIQSKLGQVITIDLDRGKSVDVLHVKALPEFNEGLSDPESPTFGLLNLNDRNEEIYMKHTPFSALVFAVDETITITQSTLVALGQMITGVRSAQELGGIIRIGAIAGDMAQSGVLALLTFMALLSINLGLINLFPIPMLDGGHLMFYAVEAIKGNPISEQIQEYAFRLGLALLVGIMLFANLNDLLQLIL